MPPSILVTSRVPSSVLTRLKTVGQVELVTDHLTPAALQERVSGKRALVCVTTDRIDSAVINAGCDLEIIANIAVGYDNIDLAAAASRGISVTNTPGVLTEAVAELTWGMILSVTRRMAEGDRLIRQKAWKGWALDFMLGMELSGKQLGIIGPGRIGRAVAARAPAFGMEVVFASRSRETVVASEKRLMPLDELLVTSDIVSLHVPLKPETRHLINRQTLARMKRSAYLINTARGPVVDEEALNWALDERLIAGVALDVFEREPEVHQGLLQRSNVVLVPHLGSATHETRVAMADLAARNVEAVLQGRPPLTPVMQADTKS
ncbi:MAG: D-glycerate dehydrogenase [Acidobacteriota bacterium]|nr:D-glycerate dehydrogenase [Acidobacteriota bacterium]